MKAISSAIFVLFFIVAYLICTLVIDPIEQRLAKADRIEKTEEQLRRELDHASEQMRSLIQYQQTRLPRQYIYPAPSFDPEASKKDVFVKMNYLRWQIEVLAVLQRIQSGKPIGDVPGMPIGSPAPVGSSNR